MTEPFIATKEQMDEVWSWIHDERRCVTTKTLSLTMGLPRSEASALLAKLPSYKQQQQQNHQHYSYECVKTCMTEQNGTTVFKLCKSILSPNDMDVDEQANDNIKNNISTVYSLALVETESVHTAHEKDMARFRDLLQDEESPHGTATTCALDPNLHQLVINNAHFGKERLTAHASQEARFSSSAMSASTAPTSSSNGRASQPTATSVPRGKVAARKATTAANFFAAKTSTKQKTNKAKGKKDSATGTTTTTAATKSSSKAAKSKSSSSSSTQTKAASVKEKALVEEVETTVMEIDGEFKTTAKSKKAPEEKENSCNGKAAMAATTVGNADDFVGDEDEDEDFLQQELERKSRNAARATKAKTKKPQSSRAKPKEQREEAKDDEIMVDIDKEDDNDEVKKVHGAMDAFAKPQDKEPKETSTAAASASTHPHKKRRKRLVEKSFTDANGYIITETQAVWEDVDEDDDEPEPAKTVAPAKKAPVKSTKHMKQGSLMGFFTKKK